MKTTIWKFFLVAVVLSGGCKKTLDINTNPNTSPTVDPKLLFTYAATSWASNRAAGDQWIPVGLAVQTVASGGDIGFGRSNVYDIPVNSSQNTWTTIYQSAGHNLDLAIRIAQSSTPASKNTAAECKIFLANIVYETTCLYGDIPFSEAWKDEISYPKFDAQKDVFEGVLKLLDEAIAQIDINSPLKIPSDYDLFYGGDMNKWIRLANSLKLRTLMTMVDKDPSKAAAIGQLVTQGKGISSAADNFKFPFYNQANKENPKNRLLKRYASGANDFFFANENVVMYMSQADPRMPFYFDKAPGAPAYEGVGSELDPTDNSSRYGIYLQRADAPEVIYAYQDELLFQAEVYARGLGVAKDLVKADQLYKKGVDEAIHFYAGNGDYTAFEATLPSLITATDPLYEIHLQQWINYMDRSSDAFTQWRRSGPEGSEVPALTRPDGATPGKLIRRYPYSEAELNANINAPKSAPKFDEKMWFDL